MLHQTVLSYPIAVWLVVIWITPQNGSARTDAFLGWRSGDASAVVYHLHNEHWPVIGSRPPVNR